MNLYGIINTFQIFKLHHQVLGVEDRGGYYESSGALKDMVQNHMLQMVALLAMEAPISLNSEDIRAEKVKVLKSLRQLKPEEVKNFVRGQYDQGNIDGKQVKSYREEDQRSKGFGYTDICIG